MNNLYYIPTKNSSIKIELYEYLRNYITFFYLSIGEKNKLFYNNNDNLYLSIPAPGWGNVIYFQVEIPEDLIAGEHYNKYPVSLQEFFNLVNLHKKDLEYHYCPF